MHEIDALAPAIIQIAVVMSVLVFAWNRRWEFLGFIASVWMAHTMKHTPVAAKYDHSECLGCGDCWKYQL